MASHSYRSALWVFALVTLASGAAVAAPTPKEKADSRTFVAEAKKATKEKRFAEAVTAMRRADELDPSPQTKLDLALALVDAGKLMEASRVLHALADGDTSAFGAKKSADAAKKLLEDLEPRIPWIQITVAGLGATKPKAKLDGAEVDPANEIFVDPGEHTIVVSASGYDTATKKVKLADGAHENVRIELHASSSSSGDSSSSSGGGSKIPGFIALGLGGLGLGVGAGFGVAALGQADDAKKLCTKGVCRTTEALNARDSSAASGTVSTVGFIVGGVFVAAGVVLLIVQPGKSGGTALQVSPWVGPGQAGLVGRF